jgi:hypothetical protein
MLTSIIISFDGTQIQIDRMTFRMALVVGLMLLTGSLAAQSIKSFSDDPEKFCSELSDLMNASKKKEGKDFVDDQFYPVFMSASYSAAMRARVISTANLMLDKKKKAYPDFENYALALISFPKSGKAESGFNQWDDVLRKFLDDAKMKKDFPAFLEGSGTLFAENVFYSTKGLSWGTSNNQYAFEFDSLPKIVFPACNLVCTAKGDSSVILGTQGTFFPTLDRWYGTGGTVTWERADFDPTKTYCEFQNYEIRTKGTSYIIDSVQFYNEFFERPLLGQLTEKVLADKSGDEASYPRFESYNQRLQIKNIFKNVDYDGGFTMAGNRLAGTGTLEEPAIITVHRENEKFLIARSLDFSIRSDRIASPHVALSIKIENDSIVHPDLNFKFDAKNREITLLREDEGRSKSPYYDSFHNVDMYFEALYWNIDDPLIEMGSLKGSTQHYAAFESKDYYKKMRYDALMGMGFSHPLVEIRDYCRASGINSFYASELAAFLRTGVQQLHPMLIDLANKGFVEYDVNNQYCVVTQKLEDTLARNSGRMDYDVIQFNSEVSNGENAQLNLLNYNLLLSGIQQIHLSDSQQVTIYPAEGQVILKKDRDFKFGGRVWAGNFEFMGKEYYFNYEEFKIDLLNVDSCRIYVEDDEARPDSYGNLPKLKVKNVLEDIAGTLKIDAPSNKGGVHSDVYPHFPIFDCVKNSYVYYDDSHIQKGVYNRDKFYYQIEPFTIDSLDNFSKKDLSFNGTLVSAGIFPDIEEPLVLMDDLSLGFEKGTSTSGLPMYGGKSNFTADISLDYNGLHGDGKLDYLTSTSVSENFIFFPDSTRGRTLSFQNNEQSGSVEIPKAFSDVTDVSFYPKEDKLTAESVDNPITFFESEATLDGALDLRPKGMSGRGTMAFQGAELDSKMFDFERRKILADTSDFRLSQSSAENIAFRTDNVNSKIDFDKRLGEFKSNGGETKIEFPVNQYVCFMDEFKWFMDDNEMELTSSRKASDDFVIDTSEEQASSNFFSINEFQDSLNFLAPKAIYDIDASIIACDKIKYIAVADSKIIPDSGRVVIQKKAKMQTLDKATVISNYVTQYHRIFNSTLNIYGRLEYAGEGDYTYYDEDKVQQIVHLDQIKVDTTLQTVAFGRIEEEDAFFLSKAFAYYGDFELTANNPYLTFDGGAQIMHECDLIERSWLQFRSEINPEDIFIPIDTNLRDVTATRLGVGVMVSSDSPIELYSTFLSAKTDRDDEGLIEALGYLYFDKKTRQYLVGSKEKISQPNLPGNLVVLNTENCEISGDGKIDFQVDLGLLTFNQIGTIKNDGVQNKTYIDGVAALDFFFDEASLKHFTDMVQAWPELNPVDITKTHYEKGIREIMGLENSDKAISDLNLNGQFKKLPDELQSTIFFADVKFEWNDVDESYQSVGALGIATIGKKQVFRYVKGKIEIEKRRSADVLRIYFELDPGNWYFFEYKLGILNITSTDLEFMELVQAVKEDKRRIKEDKQQFSFQVIASKKKRNDFVDRFREFD